MGRKKKYAPPPEPRTFYTLYSPVSLQERSLYVRMAGMTIEELDQLQAALTDEFQLRERIRDLASERK